MNKMSFASLSIDSLTRVVGGYHDPGGGGGSTSSGSVTKEPDDFAGKYVKTLKKDGQDWWAREKLGASALQNKKYGTAAKHFGAAFLDELAGIGDALTPITGIVGAKP